MTGMCPMPSLGLFDSPVVGLELKAPHMLAKCNHCIYLTYLAILLTVEDSQSCPVSVCPSLGINGLSLLIWYRTLPHSSKVHSMKLTFNMGPFIPTLALESGGHLHHSWYKKLVDKGPE